MTERLFPMIDHAKDIEILNSCESLGLVVSWEYSHGFFTWSIENRFIPWWEIGWQSLARRIDAIVDTITIGRWRPSVPCLGCTILGEYRIGVGSNLADAWQAYHCSTLCTTGDCDHCETVESALVEKTASK